MFCKYCGTELEQDQTVCPGCGQENVEETPKQKKKTDPVKLTLSIVACVLLVAVLGMIVFIGAGGQFEDVAKIFKKKENDVFRKDQYTVSDKKAAKVADEVIATIGEQKLTNRQLQVYYWMQVYDFIEYTGGYPANYGLDLSKPLAEQVCDKTTGQTWEQYFVENALMSWRRYVALNAEADKNSFVLPDDYEESMAKTLGKLITDAKDNGFASVEEMLAADMGAGASFEDYKNYLTLYYRGNLYYTSVIDALEATQSEIEAYFEANKKALEENYGLTKEIGNLTDVRHLLIKVKTTGKDENNKAISTDEDWENCRKAAQELLDQWLAGEATEESFVKLVKEKTEDDGSKETGGLYTYVYKSGQYVEEFEDWCADTARKKGDYGLVKTSYGYHIMYCVESEAAWIRYGRQCVLNEKSSENLKKIDESYSVETNYKKIAFANVDLNAKASG